MTEEVRSSDYLESVRVASTANLNLASMPATVDGVTLAVNDRLLCKDQTTASQNGIYRFDGAGKRAKRTHDADVSTDMNSGALVSCEEGTANADKVFKLTTNDPIKIGTTNLTYAEV